MPYSLTALAAEINSDPKALGYAALVTAHNADALAAKLNATYGAVTTVWRPAVPSADLLGCVTWSEVSAFTAAQWGAFQCMLVCPTVDATNALIRAYFGGLFVGKAATLAAMTAIAKCAAPTRAEELWGAGLSVSGDAIKSAMTWP